MQNAKCKMQKGFTLIEMLIVIAVIGVLAVAVLSAINPVEQMRKARDTRRRSNAAELLNAIERYYATHEENPTMTVGGDDTCSAAIQGGAIDANDLDDLITAGELKQEFVDRVTTAGNKLYVGIDPNTDLATVCYEIEAKANAASIDCPTAGTIPGYNCLPE